MEPTDSSPEAPLSPAAPGHRQPLELAARVMSIVLLGWLSLQVYFAWIAYDEGVTSLLLPIWNTVFVLGMIPIVQGIFRRLLWAHRWVVGIAVFTGVSNAINAARMDSTILWVGALLLGIIALVVKQAKPIFRDSDGNRGRVQQIIATVVTIGSVVVGLTVMNGGGSERGRAAFAAEIQESYDQATPGLVTVTVEGRELTILSKQDTDEQVDAAADSMKASLDRVGSRAKMWGVGFEYVIITNGTHRRFIAAPGAKPR